MFRFASYCSKFLLLAAAICVFGYSFDSRALSSMPSDAFNGDLSVGELPYSVDSSGIITLKLKKNSGLAKVELVIPHEQAISFIANRPVGKCKDRIQFSYTDGCTTHFSWPENVFCLGKMVVGDGLRMK